MSQNTTSRSVNMRPGGFHGRMGAPTEKAHNSKGALLRLLAYLKAEIWRVLILMAMILVTVAAGVFAPRYQSAAIDRMVRDDG